MGCILRGVECVGRFNYGVGGVRLKPCIVLLMYLSVIRVGTAQSVIVLKSTFIVNRRVFVKGG